MGTEQFFKTEIVLWNLVYEIGNSLCVNRTQFFVEFWNSERFQICWHDYNSRVVNYFIDVMGNNKVVNEENGS